MSDSRMIAEKQNITTTTGPGELLSWLRIVLVNAFCNVVGVTVLVPGAYLSGRRDWRTTLISSGERSLG
jgi:hypothetical protein